MCFIYHTLFADHINLINNNLTMHISVMCDPPPPSLIMSHTIYCLISVTRIEVKWH